MPIKTLDNMKQPAAILVLQYSYTILVIPVSSSICNTGTDTGKYLYPSIFQNFPVSAILEDTGHCQNMSIVDTGRFWEILVIPVLQILEYSGKYWLYQYCRYWKILRNTGNTSITDRYIQYCIYTILHFRYCNITILVFLVLFTVLVFLVLY